MLKYRLKTLEGLDEAVAAMYEKDGDGYKLKVDGIPQGEGVAELKAQVASLLEEKKAEAKKAKDAAEEAARKSGDVEALDNSWKEKLANRETELQAQIDALNGSITTMTVDNVAVSMANEIAVQGSADILVPHIKARLAAEQRDGQFVTVVKDGQGKPSAASLDDLKTEFANNPAFAPVILGSKASGGGAGGGGQGGGGAATGNMGGSRSERTAAISAKFPDLNS
ncbi:hypothetical protein [Microbulbifer sp. VAAF005]|uniref:hypothetical protein n=1 Tax=Microbulbifer sp. VAAF005 TaxID=3034230 RepID=UPI0024AD5204|nr:hypothetical protein [Microbulbifer sp. VAAF005]WHI46590.1 hypothetical protein P0078_23265 [Microbulbifer sp. VAAF005]